MDDLRAENPLIICEWDECLTLIEASIPETEPGKQHMYHYLSLGWLCGGIIEVFSHAHSLDYGIVPQCICDEKKKRRRRKEKGTNIKV